MNRSITIAFILVASLGLSGCVNRAAQAESKETQAILSDSKIAVQVTKVVTGEWSDNLEVTGSLVSSEDATVTASVGGKLTAVYVKDGDSVSAGQIIAIQESADYRSRRAQAQAQYDAAQSQLQQAMNDARVGPERSLAAVRAARAQLQSAESQLLKARNGARNEERRQAEAQLNAAKTALNIAKKDLDRGQTLLDEGAISEREMDRYRLAYANAQAQYESAVESYRIAINATRQEDIKVLENQVESARQNLQSALANQRLDSQYSERVNGARAQLRSAQEQINLADQALEDSKVRAPFSGKVSGKPLQPGTYAGPGTPICRLIGGDGMYFEGDVPEVSVSQIQQGQRVNIQVDALKGSYFNGTVLAINPAAQTLGRLYKVRIQIDGVPPSLKAGMFARGSVQLSERNGVVAIPKLAVVKREDKNVVFVAEGSKAVMKIVDLGLTKGERVEVKSGLNGGENLIISGQNLLVDGNPIALPTGGEK
ncbi:MAG: efflux RND transporter periplasmic adaptor subunit [Armatimonadetes bacterium]|nr:efflux RND transporter periplasmic adaptor subunit [Armatimonadota bacterium]